jgi:hypothetical protein
VLQLAGVHHRLVRPKTVPGAVFLPAKRAHIRPVHAPGIRVRNRIIRIVAVRKVSLPVFPESRFLLENYSTAVEVANALAFVNRLNVSLQLKKNSANIQRGFLVLSDFVSLPFGQTCHLVKLGIFQNQ